MILKQYYLGCLSHASYLIGDERSRTAVVVDPQRDVGEYLADAQAKRLSIRHVFLTHFHADFVAGHLELAEKTGATIHLGKRAEAEYAFHPVGEKSSLALGSVRLEFLETPGHTPEGICILVYDESRSPRAPHAILTGDTLFVGDVGRPDLLASAGHSAEEMAGWLYDSLHGKILTLPDETLVYPAHGAGSPCGRSLGTETFSTLGDQRRFNPALHPMSRAEFVRQCTRDLPPAPAYFSHASTLNRCRRPILESVLEKAAQPFSMEEALRLQGEGVQFLDTRSPAAFAAGHLPCSLQVGLDGRFAQWAGSVLDPLRPILIIADAGRAGEAALRLGRIGFDRVTGHLGEAVSVLGADPERIRSIPRLDPPTLVSRMSAPVPPRVLDVRNPAERERSRIEVSLHIPLGQLRERMEELPRDREIVVYCAGGYRSMIAASMLEAGGYPACDLEGGMQAWPAPAPDPS